MEEKNEEKEPSTERKREYTDFGLDLGETDEEVSCHTYTLAVAMIDEVCRVAET